MSFLWRVCLYSIDVFFSEVCKECSRRGWPQPRNNCLAAATPLSLLFRVYILFHTFMMGSVSQQTAFLCSRVYNFRK